MLRTYMQLTPERDKGHWRFQHDDEDLPLSSLYQPDIVALMIDVTDLDPQPEEGWLYSEGKFSEPPPLMQAEPDKEDLKRRLRQLVLDKQTMTLLAEDITEVEAAISDLVDQIKEMDNAA